MRNFDKCVGEHADFRDFMSIFVHLRTYLSCGFILTSSDFNYANSSIFTFSVLCLCSVFCVSNRYFVSLFGILCPYLVFCVLIRYFVFLFGILCPYSVSCVSIRYSVSLFGTFCFYLVFCVPIQYFVFLFSKSYRAWMPVYLIWDNSMFSPH